MRKNGLLNPKSIKVEKHTKMSKMFVLNVVRQILFIITCLFFLGYPVFDQSCECTIHLIYFLYSPILFSLLI